MSHEFHAGSTEPSEREYKYQLWPCTPPVEWDGEWHTWLVEITPDGPSRTFRDGVLVGGPSSSEP